MSWPRVKLGEVATINPRLPKDVDDSQHVSFVAMASASEDGYLLGSESRVLSETRKGFTYFDKDDVLLAKITPCFENGKCLRPGQISTEIGFGSTEFHVIRPDSERVDGLYLFYIVWNEQFRFLGEKSMSGAAGQKRVGSDFLKGFEIPLPPLPEQKRIAAILEKTDAIRRKRQQAIQLADDFLRSVFLDMFGNPVTNPKRWEVKPVGDLCDCIVPGRDKPRSFTGSTPWITTNELSHLGITLKKESYLGLSADEISEVRAKVVPKNSVIMTCVGDLGVISIAGEDMVINQQLHAFLPGEKLTPSFLSYALAWQKAYMLRIASSTTLPYMNKAVCNSVPVMLPPKEMQSQFETLVAKIAAYKSKLLRFTNESAFQSLSHKTFLGQL